MLWQPSTGDFGFGTAFIGSIYLVALTLPLAIVFGWIVCLQLSNCKSPWLRSLNISLLEAWVSLPSVVIGVWAISAIIPQIRAIYGTGYCALSAAIGLAIFIIPTTSLLFYRSYQKYQEQFGRLEKSFGLSELEKTTQFMRSRFSSVISITNYSFCRLFGETMVVLMLSGNSVQIPGNPFEGVRTLTTTISLEMAYASEQHEMALFALASIAIATLLTILLPQFGRFSHD